MKSLPARPSLESLRKQAKKLARDIAAGDAAAIARVRAHLTSHELPLTQRDAQLVIAREYGFAGWQELVAEVTTRVGDGLEWAVPQARRAIHDHDIERLKELLAEFPALLSWRGEEDDGSGLLGFATNAYGDAGTEQREHWFTRADAAEVLIDAGAVVAPSVVEGILRSRAKGLRDLFQRKGLLPKTLKFFAASGDLDAVRGELDRPSTDLAAVNEAFSSACRFGHVGVASLLLDRAMALDPELGARIDQGIGPAGFIEYLIDDEHGHVFEPWPWAAFVMARLRQAIKDRDLAFFVAELRNNPSLLGDDFVPFQNDLIVNATLNDREEFIVALFDLDPAILRRQPPPRSLAIEVAFTYAHTNLLSLLTRVWPLPDDLPSAAGLGNLSRVEQWFDEPHEQPASQRTLDEALAYAVINRHFEDADFLLAHGANINTDWNSHEPASILHHLVFEDAYESMQYLIDRGIDMTIKDSRWDATAEGWARFGKGDEKMAEWLADAERRRSGTSEAKLS